MTNISENKQQTVQQKSVANLSTTKGISSPAVPVLQDDNIFKNGIVQNKSKSSVPLIQLAGDEEASDWEPKHLVSGKLNVAGENHTEWGAEWRALEEIFSQEIVGGPRWQEQEFIGVMPHDERKEEIHGDGILEMLRFTIEKAEYFSSLFLRHYNLKKENAAKKACLIDQIPKIDVYLKAVDKLQSNPFTPKERRIVVELKPIFELSNHVHIELGNFLSDLNRDGEQPDFDEVKDEIKNLVDGLVEFTYQQSIWYGKLSRNEGQKELGERERRSLHMHLVAEGTFSKVGIWKIGDLHVHDIGSFPLASNRPYNMVSKELYDKEIQSWAQTRGWLD